jgi:hypothetical protein
MDGGLGTWLACASLGISFFNFLLLFALSSKVSKKTAPKLLQEIVEESRSTLETVLSNLESERKRLNAEWDEVYAKFRSLTGRNERALHQALARDSVSGETQSQRELPDAEILRRHGFHATG